MTMRKGETLPFKTIRKFIQLETSGAILLFIAAVLALIVSNTPLKSYYSDFFNLPATITLGFLTLSKPLLLWINDGLMTIFFILVGLEIKRELFEGELNSAKKAALPAIAALGGMIAPALIYIYFNKGNSIALAGWAIPTATDIAFSLGILGLLGSRVPLSLKVFLTALAIFDDIGAILIIATFYTKDISLHLLLAAAGLIILLLLMNRFRVMRLTPYILVGIVLWLCVLKSGVHATLAGIILAFCIPLRDKRYRDVSPARKLEQRLHPWVIFGILPIFAFANAGLSLGGLTQAHFLHPVPLGIAFGLFFGKQIGICLASYIGIMMGCAKIPERVSYLSIYGISLVAGVGFTMSLFIGTLAFEVNNEAYGALVRMGVMAGSLFSGVLGYLILRTIYRP